jgi:hypothetical protein
VAPGPGWRGCYGGVGSFQEEDVTSTESVASTLGELLAVLERLGVPFQAVGGLAARAHGATRALVDLDFYVPDEHLPSIAEALSHRVVRPPARHRDAHWDLIFMALTWGGWRIEVAGADSARVWSRTEGSWMPAGIDFAASQVREVGGVQVPVMPLDQLIAYKRGLDRPVDRLDVLELESLHPRGA